MTSGGPRMRLLLPGMDVVGLPGGQKKQWPPVWHCVGEGSCRFQCRKDPGCIAAHIDRRPQDPDQMYRCDLFYGTGDVDDFHVIDGDGYWYEESRCFVNKDRLGRRRAPRRRPTPWPRPPPMPRPAPPPTE